MPNTKEIELWRLVDKALQNSIEKFGDVFSKDVTRDLIAHGVTVQEGKPLEAFLHPVVAHKGLKAKYLVFGAASGKEIKNCFVLRPDKDPAAVEALRAYARTTDNETLAEDIYNWVGKGGPVQEWISVKDGLPEENGYYLCVVCVSSVNQRNEYRRMILFWEDNVWIDMANSFRTKKPLYWMPLPEPPKEV